MLIRNLANEIIEGKKIKRQDNLAFLDSVNITI